MNSYTIDKDLSLYDALVQIEQNHLRSLIVLNSQNKVVGSLSDGDIRRALIDGISLNENISSCYNQNFLWASSEESREQLLKKLDSNIQILPILDKALLDASYCSYILAINSSVVGPLA